MDDQQLNLLIKRISRMKAHNSPEDKDPRYQETLKMLVSQLNSQYGIYLTEMLFEIYDEYCADGGMEALETYLSPEGVPFEVTDQPGQVYALKLKPFPLRFVIEQDNETRNLKVA